MLQLVEVDEEGDTVAEIEGNNKRKRKFDGG